MIDSPSSPATLPVSALRPDPEVWATALREAGGDARRLEVINAHAVVVHNSPRR